MFQASCSQQKDGLLHDGGDSFKQMFYDVPTGTILQTGSAAFAPRRHINVHRSF